MAKPVLYLATRTGRQRARQQMAARMADLFDPNGSLVASLRPMRSPTDCCSLGVCTASMVASAGGRAACCIAGTCFSNGWQVHH